MQTSERSNTPAPPRGPRSPGRRIGSAAAVAIGIAAMVPVLLLMVFSRWGVLVVVLLAIFAGIGIWVWQRSFLFIEVVAFLIHFDGVGVGPVRMGRVVAGVGGCLLIYKLVVERWRPPAVPARHWGPVWVLVIWAVFSGAWSASTGTWMFALGQVGLAAIYFCICGLMVDSQLMIQKFLRAFWYGGLFGSAGGVFGLAIGARSFGFGSDPNFFGLLEASLIPLTVYYRRNCTTVWQKRMYTLVLIFVLVGAASAGSRSGLIGGAVAIVATMVTRPGLTPSRRASVGVSSLFVGAIAFAVGFVMNPANLQRGFSDRGAGRLDLWNVSLALIREQPIIGYGLGQLRLLIPQYLLTTPGSERLGESRTEVSAHNTWLDIAGDLGLVGSAIFATILVVALVGFLRPRWREARELSTVLFIMMLPLLSGMFFLPLLNNKLAWALVGLAAAVQVPSWGARWSGLPGTVEQANLPVPVGSGAGPPAPVGSGAAPAAPGTAAATEDSWDAVRLARWDLRVSRRGRMLIVLGAVLGAIAMGAVASTFPTNYTATAGIYAQRMDGPEQIETVFIDRERLQGVLTTVVSHAYAAELKELAGLDLSTSEIIERMSVTKPGLGSYLQIEYRDTSEANTLAVAPHLVTALDNVFLMAIEMSEAQTANELRPMIPGEQRYYTGEFYVRAYSDAVVADHPPRTFWQMFVGFLTGALIAAGFVLSQQRIPRVNNDDDFPAVTGLAVWAHVGRQGRRYGATADQYAHVLAATRDRLPPGREPRRLVVTGARHDRAIRGLAVGIAAELASEGRRVLLVDAQLDRPGLTVRLGSVTRSGLSELGAGRVGLPDVMRRVSTWRLPTAARHTLAGGSGELRFIGAGRFRRNPDHLVPLEPFDAVDPEVYMVVLSPPIIGDIANAPVLGWGDAVVLGLVEGRTVTFDAEDAASRVRSFGAGPSGIVLLDV